MTPTRMPARAAEKPKQDRTRDAPASPDPDNKAVPYGAVPEPREKPKSGEANA